MTTRCVRCQVFVIRGQREEKDRPRSRGHLRRDLLPWADPYIAGLVRQVVDSIEAEAQDKFNPGFAPADDADPDHDFPWEVWQDDAFMPQTKEYGAEPSWPVFGDYALLDDRFLDDDAHQADFC